MANFVNIINSRIESPILPDYHYKHPTCQYTQLTLTATLNDLSDIRYIYIRKKKICLQVVFRSSSGCLQVLQVLCEDNLCKVCLPEAPEDNYCKTVSVKTPEAPEDNYCKTYLLLM